MKPDKVHGYMYMFVRYVRVYGMSDVHEAAKKGDDWIALTNST